MSAENPLLDAEFVSLEQYMQGFAAFLVAKHPKSVAVEITYKVNRDKGVIRFYAKVMHEDYYCVHEDEMPFLVQIPLTPEGEQEDAEHLEHDERG